MNLLFNMNKLRILRAYCCFQAGNELAADDCLEDAMSMYEKAIKLNPRKSEYYRLMALTAIEMESFEEAIRLINMYKKFRFSHKSFVHLVRGDAWFGLGQYKKAYRSYCKIAPSISHLGEVKIRKVRCFLAKNKYDLAMKQLDKPYAQIENSEFNFYRGVCYFFKANYRSAIMSFNKAGFDPRFRENLDLLFLKACSHYNIGEYQRAIISYQELLSLDPSQTSINFNLTLAKNKYEESKT